MDARIVLGSEIYRHFCLFRQLTCAQNNHILMLKSVFAMLQGIVTFNSLDPNKQVQVQTLSSNDTIVILPGVVHSVRFCTQACFDEEANGGLLHTTNTSATHLRDLVVHGVSLLG